MPHRDSPDPPPDLLETIRGRRTVRRFDPDRPVPDAMIRTVLTHACLAPSAFNLQPWRFLVICEARNRRSLRACVGNSPRIDEAPVAVVVLGYQASASSHLDLVLESMRELGAVTQEGMAELRGRARSWEKHNDDPARWSGRTAMLAAATLMLSAEALGLGSAILEVTDETTIRDAFGIPDDHGVCCVIALGFPATASAFPGRLGLDEVCHGEHFGSPLPVVDDGDPGGR